MCYDPTYLQTKAGYQRGLKLHTKVGYNTMFKVAAGIIVGLITFCSGPLGWALFALIAATWAGIVLSVRATLLLVRISYMVAKLALQAVWGALVVAGRLMLALAVVSLASKALAGRR